MVSGVTARSDDRRRAGVNQAPALFDTSIFECQRAGIKIPEENVPLITSLAGTAMVPARVPNPIEFTRVWEPSVDRAGNTILMPAILHYRLWLSRSPRFESLESLDKYRPGWRQFPSLVGSVEDPVNHYLGGDSGEEHVIRLWDVTPVTASEAQDILDRGAEALDTGRWYDLFQWGEMNYGIMEYGYDDYEDEEGQTPEQIFEGLSRDLFECKGEFPTDFFGANQPEPIIGDFKPGVGEYSIHLPPDLDRRWRLLLARSQISWSVANRILRSEDLRAWDRERGFSPWA